MIPTASEWLDMNHNNTTDMLIDFAKLHCAEQARVINEKVCLLKQSDWGTYENIDPSSKPDFSLVDIVNINKYGHGDCTYYIITVSKDSILNAYPLDNIK